MSYKRVLTIQDISCFGQCSLTVALPLISACGVECCILPSAVLSTHTAGFTGFTVRDLSKDFKAIFNHWNKEGIEFDAIYTGYLGSEKQIDDILKYYNGLKKKPMLIVDPAMGDNGKLYPAFDINYAKAMRKLCDAADIILPNMTELNYLYNTEKVETGKIKADSKTGLKACLKNIGADMLVLTGYSDEKGQTGVLVANKDFSYAYSHEKMKESRHGTGDIYSSVFVGALMNGKDACDSAKIAADFTLSCIKHVQGDKEHFYGVKFEQEIPYLIKLLAKK